MRYTNIGKYVLRVVENDDASVSIVRFGEDAPKDEDGFVDISKMEFVSMNGYVECNICHKFFKENMDENYDRRFSFPTCKECGKKTREEDQWYRDRGGCSEID